MEINHPAKPVYTIDPIRNFNEREMKCWRAIDYILSRPGKGRRKINPAVKLEAARFILNRIYPEEKTASLPNISQIVIVEKQSTPTPQDRDKVASRSPGEAIGASPLENHYPSSDRSSPLILDENKKPELDA